MPISLLLVNGVQNLVATLYRRLGESLAGAQLAHGAGPFKFLFVPLQCAVNRLVIFYVDNQHRTIWYYVWLSKFRTAKKR